MTAAHASSSLVIMCGITFIVNSVDKSSQDITSVIQSLKCLVSRRGPDCSGSHDAAIPGTKWQVEAHGSTLWTQGSSPTLQPLTTERGSVLLWNGDAYDDGSLLESDSLRILRNIEVIGNPLSTLSSMCGPYAFIYFNPETRRLWFGRDPIGRCSLLIHFNEGQLVISSAMPRTVDCVEVPNRGIFEVIFTENSYEICLHPWADLVDDLQPCRFVSRIEQSIQHRVLDRRRYLDEGDVQPNPDEIYVSCNKSSEKVEPLDLLKSLSSLEQASPAVDTTLKLLRDSVRTRLSVRPDFCQNCRPSPEGECKHSKVAILFSGGLDSTLLAVLAHQVLKESEPIDLYNVAFEKPSSKASSAPDRITGHLALVELNAVAPDRKWNFVEITIDEKELANKVGHIADLIHPLNSVLDESLGCALWFAAQGRGLLDSNSYESPARIVLVGMGADELFGGYSRHAKIFQHTGSWTELGKMLLKEVQNIGSRNLGRDNRVVSDHGRMMRTPFLDERFVTFVNRLPPWVRCCPSADVYRGVGDKTLLRLVALSVGLRGTAVQPKRALQFGSRIANSKQKGHEVSSKLTL